MRFLSPKALAGTGLFLVGVAALILWLTPASGYDIRLVDPAHPVAPLVQVPNEKTKPGSGTIYFVDVRERQARLLERILPWLRADGSSLVRSPPISTALERRLGEQEMSDSQKIAAVVALGQLGYDVRARSGGVTVLLVQSNAPAARVLQPDDVIVSAAGRQVRTVTDLRAILAHDRPGVPVKLRFRRGGTLHVATVKTIADPEDSKRAIVGIQAEDHLQIKLPIRVSINADGVGGPSAGLAFALDILEELGRDVAHGRKVAATGALALDGTVEPIGGVKQKTLGARRAGVDVFLVPAGDNAREARRYANGLRIVPVETFPQALRSLATIGRKA